MMRKTQKSKQRLGLAEYRKLKALDCAPRGRVLMTPGMHQFKTAAENFSEAGGIVSIDRKAAAFLRPVRCECADDDRGARLDRLVEAGNIGTTIGSIG